MKLTGWDVTYPVKLAYTQTGEDSFLLVDGEYYMPCKWEDTVSADLDDGDDSDHS